MTLQSQLQYWRDGEWWVGRLAQVPGVFSQGRDLAELEANILDAYQLMMEEHRSSLPAQDIQTKELELPA